MVTLLLLIVNAKHFGTQSRPFITKGMGCCANASQFYIRSCPILLTDLWLVMAPSNFHFFVPLKHLAGKRFATHANMKQAVPSWLQTLGTNLYYSGTIALMLQWNKCFKRHRWLQESPMCISAIHVPHTVHIEVRIKLLASECLLPYFLEHTGICTACNTLQLRKLVQAS
jgi:hypothetical protein